MGKHPAWATSAGDVWAERWPQLDRALAGVAEILDPAVAALAPPGPFRALDIGCGAGSTSLALASARPDAAILACDVSPALIEIASGRLAGLSAQPHLADAQHVAPREGPFDLFYSRHGVMFFAEPVRAFEALRSAASGRSALIFSCFDNWTANAWASGLSAAAAGHPVDPPGRDPGAFAFASADYVCSILEAAGWHGVTQHSFGFRYIAGRGSEAVDEALSLLCAVGPASIILRELGERERSNAIERMRTVIERHFDGSQVAFGASACLWTASAAA